ncbi:MAG: hypothetical protein K0U98_05625 [Deltaproteobacteria bacterium]|nr:hypothetical protein [Deltaproteobacteria bacterium]
MRYLLAFRQEPWWAIHGSSSPCAQGKQCIGRGRKMIFLSPEMPLASANRRFSVVALMSLLIIGVVCSAPALGQEVCSGIETFRNTLENGEVPNQAQLIYLKGCLSRLSWSSLNQPSKELGSSLATFLALNSADPCRDARNCPELGGRLSEAAAMLGQLKKVYQDDWKPGQFHSLAHQARLDLERENASGGASPFTSSLSSVQPRPRNNEERFASLDALIVTLQERAAIATQTADELGVGGSRSGGKPPEPSPGPGEDSSRPEDISVDRNLEARLDMKTEKLREEFSPGVASPGFNSPGVTFGRLAGALAGALSLLLWFLHFAVSWRKRRSASSSPERNVFPAPKDESAEVSKLQHRVEDLAHQLRGLSSGKVALEELTTLREMLEGRASETESSWKQALQHFSHRLSELENLTPSSAPEAAVQRIEGELRLVAAELKKSQAVLAARVEKLQHFSSLPDHLEARPFAATLELERQALGELWVKVQGSLQGTIFEESFEGVDLDLRLKVDEIRSTLPASLSSSVDLSSAALAAAQPVLEASTLLSKLTVIKKILGATGEDEAPLDADTASRKLFQLRDFSYHLLSLVNTDEGRRRLEFRLEDWVREDFQDFADQFFRHYWQLELEGRHEDLEEAKGLVVEILLWGQLQVIEIVPGKSNFESSLHIGRSTAVNPTYPEGTILGVVGVGFLDLTSDRVLQHPEVIVNRH